MYIIRFSTRYVESACTAERFRRYCCTNAVLHFHRRRTEPVCFRKLYSLKQECHFDEILVTGCTASCHFDNFRCSQWRKFHQNGISVSVFMGLAVWISTFIPEENGHHFCRRHFRKHFPECKSLPLQWRHNGHDGVSNHQHRHCLLNRLFRCRSKKASELLVTGLCAGNSPVTGEFPTQMASNAENVSIWWRHHADFTEVGKHCWSLFSTREDFNYLCHLSVKIWSKIQIYFMFPRINSARLGLIYPLQWRHNGCDAIASQITGVSIVCSVVCSDAEHRHYQSSVSLAFMRMIHRWPVDSPRKGPVTRKMYPFDDVIMLPISAVGWSTWSYCNAPCGGCGLQRRQLHTVFTYGRGLDRFSVSDT